MKTDKNMKSRNYIATNMNEVMEDLSPEFPCVMHVTDLTEEPFPWHWHEELELGFLEEGKTSILTTEGEFPVVRDDVFFINNNTIHMFESHKENIRTVETVSLFHPVLLSGHYHSIFETKYIRPITLNRQLQVVVLKSNTPAAKEIKKRLKKISSIINEQDSEIFIRNLLSEAWLYLFNEISANPALISSIETSAQTRIRTMISFIIDNFTENITLEDIANSANISTREATRAFKKHINQSPMDYLNSYRLSSSMKHLKSTDDSITDIAYKCGFNDSAYYSRAFKKRFGITPREYREKG